MAIETNNPAGGLPFDKTQGREPDEREARAPNASGETPQKPPQPDNPASHDGEVLLHRYLDGRVDDKERGVVDEWLRRLVRAK